MFLLPALFALWTIMFFNYIQHVHTDPGATTTTRGASPPRS
jgi:hypothetical protein